MLIRSHTRVQSEVDASMGSGRRKGVQVYVVLQPNFETDLLRLY